MITKYGSLLIIILLFGAIIKDGNLIEIVKMLGIPVAIVAIWGLIDQLCS